MEAGNKEVTQVLLYWFQSDPTNIKTLTAWRVINTKFFNAKFP